LERFVGDRGKDAVGQLVGQRQLHRSIGIIRSTDASSGVVILTLSCHLTLPGPMRHINVHAWWNIAIDGDVPNRLPAFPGTVWGVISIAAKWLKIPARIGHGSMPLPGA